MSLPEGTLREPPHGRGPTIFKIPVMRPQLPPFDSSLTKLEKVWESGVFSNYGPTVRTLEGRLEDFLRAPVGSVVTAANATLAITAAALALGGSKWVLPSWTFTASVAALVLAGKSPTFADIEVESQELDVSDIDERFDGVLMVAPFGSPLRRPSSELSKPVIIDAAASLGAAEGALETIGSNEIIVFSLHATKVLGSGEGGFVVCGSRELADQVRSILNFGFGGSRQSSRQGFNGKMSEIGAAIALSALDDWESEKNDWLSAREVVRDLAHDLGMPHFDPSGDWVAPYWIVQFTEKEMAARVETLLTAAHIETRRWWGEGCHEMAAYRDIPSLNLSTTRKVASGNLGLPFYRGLGMREANAIHDALSGHL